MKLPVTIAAAAGVALGALAVAPSAANAEVMEQFIPVTTYDTGPYAVNGQPFMDGFVDYMKMLNARDGGINGVKLIWEECETGYKPDRFVECYERLKNKGPTGAAAFNPLGTGLTYAVIDRAPKDKIPIISLGYGRTDATDGSVHPYIFPAVTNYWSQNTTKIKYIGSKEGGMDKLKGLKIANLYIDIAYGKETIPVLKAQSEKYGFELLNFPLAAASMQDQKAVWLQIRRAKPDWVILRGWGIMNQTALKEAARTGFPRTKMLGVWWSCAEQDTVPAGKAAIGYTCAGFHAAGTDFPVVKDILKDVYGKGDGAGPDKAVGTILWNRGVATAIFTIEGIKRAQTKYGNKPMTGEQVRWGLENIDLTASYLKDIGATGLLPVMKLSCNNHEGSGMVRFVTWDGKKWQSASDWIESDQSIVRPMVEASAAKYAAEKGITPRKCDGSD